MEKLNDFFKQMFFFTKMHFRNLKGTSIMILRDPPFKTSLLRLEKCLILTISPLVFKQEMRKSV